MSYAVATMKKMKIENIKGIERHNQRETDRHSNPDIDISRSNLNYDLVNENPINYQADISNYIQQKRQSKRAVRKDAVVLNEWIIGSDQDYFAKLSDDQIRQYFQAAVEYFGQKFGSDNIRYASVHLDESTPHMHMGIVPITDDGRLSSKDVFSRNNLSQVQAEFPKFMQERGFNVQRGHSDGERKKLTVKEYKEIKQSSQKLSKSRRELKRTMSGIIKELVPEATVTDDKGQKRPLSSESGLRMLEKFSLSNLRQVFLEQIEIFRQWVKDIQQKLHVREQNVQARERELERKSVELDKQQEVLERKENNLGETLQAIVPYIDAEALLINDFDKASISRIVARVQEGDQINIDNLAKAIKLSGIKIQDAHEFKIMKKLVHEEAPALEQKTKEYLIAERNNAQQQTRIWNNRRERGPRR